MCRRLVLVGGIVCAVTVIGAWAQEPPALSEVEQLKVQIHQLREALVAAVQEADVCRATLGALRTQVNTDALEESRKLLQQEIERAHPDAALDLKSWTLRVKASPDPPAAAEPAPR